MRVLVFGTYDVRAHPRVQVVIDGLRAHGVTVDECNAPLGLDTDARVRMLKEPWRLPLFALTLLRRWASLVRQARRASKPDAVIVAYLGHFDVHLAKRLFRGTPILLDHFIFGSDTAKDRNVSSPLRDRVLRWVDDAALKAADVVFVDTHEHRDLMPEWARPKGVVVPIGAPDEWAAPERPPYDGSRPLRVIFFGLFTPLQGPDTIGKALALLADDANVHVAMAGGGQELASTQALAQANRNVEWLGMVPPAEMPMKAREYDVALGIFGTGPKALRVVPNKAYQGIRTGCAIITSDTEPQRRMLGDVPVYVPPGDPEALADALRTLANDSRETADRQQRSRDASEKFAPYGVVTELVEALRSR